MHRMALVLKDCTSDELHAQFGGIGLSPKFARRLQAAIFQRRSPDVPAQLPEVPRRVLDEVRRQARFPRLKLLERSVSPADGFAKYLFQGDGPEPFEAIRIPLMHRPGDRKYIVCVSSQAGCALGCTFCATAKLGFQRNLQPWEIVDQVLQVQADSEHPVRGVVFMGMGEPFLNYDRVMRAAAILCEPCGMAIDAKAITISTVGVVPMIRRFTEEHRPYRLVVSLTSADSEKRKQLLPIEHTHPLPELMAALRERYEATGKRMVLAWTLLGGVNTRPEDARQLAELTRGLPIVLDLIDVNGSVGGFRRPTEEELNTFRDALTAELGMPVVRRYSGGQDIDGACGMLAGKRISLL